MLSTLSRARNVGIRGTAAYFYSNYLNPPTLLWRLTGYADATVNGIPLKLSIKGFPSRESGGGIPAFRNHLELLAHGKWEPEVLSFLADSLRSGDVFIDVGAWMGVHSIYSSILVRESGRVHSFEPDPVAQFMLQRNILLNHAANIAVHKEALSDEEGTASLTPGAGFGMSYSRLLERPSEAKTGMTVRTTTLDHFVSTSGIKPKVVKIDVEGFEDKVISGGKRTFSDDSTFIVLEFHSRLLVEREQNPRAVFRSLFQFGKDVVGLTTFERLEMEDPIPGEKGCRWNDGHLAILPESGGVP